jgi:hypothetical protein
MNRRDLLLGSIAGMIGGTIEAEGALQGRADLGPGANLNGLQVFPADNPWNLDISRRPVDRMSTAILKRIGLEKPLHPDFGTTYRGVPNGIPYNVISGTQKKVPVRFVYQDESDPGPYPIPPDAAVEGGPAGRGDRHVLVIDRDNRKLYEMYDAHPDPDGQGWSAVSGAIFDLSTNKLRPANWTSADAAGLPVFPGLARYEEAAVAKVIRHAFRFTVVQSRRAYLPPARHFASPHHDLDLAPMGMRVRLKGSLAIDAFPPQAKVILQALKTYGMILADNGSDWYVSGSPDPRWDDKDLSTLKRFKVKDFEVVAMEEVVEG